MPLFGVRRPGRQTTVLDDVDRRPDTAAGAPPHADSAPLFGVSRVAALSDGIFAIAITLLVFALEVPDVSQPTSPGELREALDGMWPQFSAYFQTFLIVGAFWIGHHRAFRRMVGEDDRLVWLNLLFLLTVSFMPFPANLVGRYPENRTAVVVYSASLAAVSLTYAALWAYIKGARLVSPAARPAARIELRTAVSAAALFVAAIPLSFVDLDLAAVCSNAVILVLLAATRSYRKMNRPSRPAGGAAPSD